VLLIPALGLGHSAFAKCPNGTHKSPGGNCEKFVPHKGLPRCPNGSHRSPDGSHCEKVSDGGSSSKKNDDKSSSSASNHKSKSESDSSSSKSNSPQNNPDSALPAPTLSEGIELSGPITYVVDGDTLDVNNIRIRLALVNTPEVGEAGFLSAKAFVENRCLNKNGEVDMDDGQRQGSFGREIGVVYCDGKNINQELMSNHLAIIDTRFCDVSEFADEIWARSSCSNIGSSQDDGNNSVPDSSDKSPSVTESNPQTLSNSNYRLLTKWGGFGSGHGQLSHPASIDTDPNGQRFYIADLDNNRVQVLHSGGNFINEWGTLGKGNGQLNNPGSIAVDDLHKVVFVADIKNNRIEKFDIEGNFITHWGSLGKADEQFDHPGDIALDPDNEILYVTDIYNNRIQEFYYDGNFISKWGSFGTGDGQFNRPAGIAFNPKDSLVYVSDTVNDRIQVFDGDGNFITKWGSFGSGNGQFNRPDGIHFDPSEKMVYVADRKNHRIQVFDTQGVYQDKWTVSDIQSGNLIKPRDITLDSSGKAYVVDKENNNILIYGVSQSNNAVSLPTPISDNQLQNQEFITNVSSLDKIATEMKFKQNRLIKEYYDLSDYTYFKISENSRICPNQNCKFELDKITLTPAGINGLGLGGIIKVDTGNVKKILNIYSDFQPREERVVNGEKIETIDGTFRLGKEPVNNAEFTYNINGTLLTNGKNKILTIEGIQCNGLQDNPDQEIDCQY